MSDSCTRPATLSDAKKATAALWTPQGRGAVATIRICGDCSGIFNRPESMLPFRAANGLSLLDQPLGRIVFGHWGAAPAEDIVVCRLSAHETEIHCHGGVSAARRILTDWNSVGIPTVAWQDQVAQSSGVLATDCLTALTQATTLRTACILMDQENAWRSFAARAVDWSERGDWHSLLAEITTASSWSDFGRHLLEPFQVVLTGPPNVGKSALLNALVGYQRAVVFDQPGTTRDVVTAETAFDGWPVRLIDTAGLRDEATGLEAAGIQLAHEQIENADLVLRVFDASAGVSVALTDDVREIVVANKIDLVSNQIDFEGLPAVAVSAMTGSGIENLIAAAVRRLVPRTPAIGTLIPVHERQRDWLMKLNVAINDRAVSIVSEIAGDIFGRWPAASDPTFQVEV